MGSWTSSKSFTIRSIYFKLKILQPVYTDAYLCDLEKLDEISRFLEVIDELIDESIGIPSDYELVLELSYDEARD